MRSASSSNQAETLGTHPARWGRVLDDGRVIAAGTHDQLVHSCAVYRDICRSQHIEEGL